MFETNFSGHNKNWEGHKKLGSLPPNVSRGYEHGLAQ